MLDHCFPNYSPQNAHTVSKGILRPIKIDTKLNKHTAGVLKAFNNANALENLLGEIVCSSFPLNLATEPIFMKLIFLRTYVWEMLMMEDLRFKEVK